MFYISIVCLLKDLVFMVGCWLYAFNDPLGQYFGIYRAVSKREGERKEIG